MVKYYGLTKDSINGEFMLVMDFMDIDLREYLKQNRNQILWKTKIKIIFEIVKALCRIHEENSVHKDLHSGNVLHSKDKDDWYISDLGGCGPADKPLKSLYGNLAYIAPEVILNNHYSFKSDIYSVAMLMWEIMSEQPPFVNQKDDYDLALNIVKGIRPQIFTETPSIFKELIEQCWDADPVKRLDIKILWKILEDINTSLNKNSDYVTSTYSKIYSFQMPNMLQPRNATKGNVYINYYLLIILFIILTI